jgi:type VI protein secretion system component VasK
MTWTRIATALGAFVLLAFFLLMLVAGPWGVTTGIMVAIALVGLIVAGSLLYGRNSRYGAVAARNKAAQEAHDRAADLAADARRAAAEAANSGERFCPMDPAIAHAHATTNGHAPTPQPQPQPPSP